MPVGIFVLVEPPKRSIILDAPGEDGGEGDSDDSSAGSEAPAPLVGGPSTPPAADDSSDGDSDESTRIAPDTSNPPTELANGDEVPVLTAAKILETFRAPGDHDDDDNNNTPDRRDPRSDGITLPVANALDANAFGDTEIPSD